MSKHEVEQFFSGCGSIANIWIAQKPPGFAFAEFLTAEDAEAAVAACDGKELHGRRIKVEVSNTTHKPGMPREGRGGGFRGGFGGPQADFGRGPPEQAYGRDYGRDRAPDYRNDYRDSRSDRDRSDRDRDVSAQETTRWTLHCNEEQMHSLQQHRSHCALPLPFFPVCQQYRRRSRSRSPRRSRDYDRRSPDRRVRERTPERERERDSRRSAGGDDRRSASSRDRDDGREKERERSPPRRARSRSRSRSPAKTRERSRTPELKKDDRDRD